MHGRNEKGIQRFQTEILKGRHHLGDLGTDGVTILKMIYKK
jgi:hypothetical protein